MRGAAHEPDAERGDAGRDECLDPTRQPAPGGPPCTHFARRLPVASRAVTGIDWIIVAFAALMALQGSRSGFIVGVLSLAGFVAGAFVGTRVGPLLLPDGNSSPYAPLFGLMGAVLAGSVLAGGLEGVGLMVRRRLVIPGVGAVDAGLGALLSVLIALAMAWLAGAILLQAPQASRDLRRDIQRSAILRRLNDVLPPSGVFLHALARFDPFPSVSGPEARVPAPRAKIARDADVKRAAAGVVRVLGTACGLGIEGSGWIAKPGVVVTNAHVVAGEDDTVVQLQGIGPRLRAQAIAFDSKNDIAVLKVDGLGGRALPIAPSAPVGGDAAVLGFPRNGPYDVRAARIGQTRRVISQDAYGRGPVARVMLSLRGLVRHGNSGGPLVDAQGRVVGTVFAASAGARRGGFAVPDTVVQRILNGANGSVDTGPCAP
jgi:S1-C subfamily serine protease